jgi:DNA-binding Lrp family transcriptional regulator
MTKNTTIKLPDFIIIPYPLLQDEKITLIDERLYGVIYWMSKMRNERCIASNPTLASLVKTTDATIQNSLTKLEQRGYIKRIYGDENRKIRLEIIPLVVFSKIKFTPSEVSPTNDTVSLTDDTEVSLTDDQSISIYNTKYKNKNNTSKTEVLQGKDFNEFIDLFKDVNPMYTDFYKNRTERKALEDMAEKWGREKLLSAIKELPRIITIPFAPKITKPSELRRDIGKLIAFYQQEKNKNKKIDNKIAFT